MKRTREIQRAVAQIRLQQRRGVKVDPLEIEQRFGHLMPELAGRLQLLEEIQASARRVEPAAAEGPRNAPSPAAVPTRRGAAEDDDLNLLGRALPDYQLIERISDGAQGVLYRARHKPTDRVVVLKVLLDGPLASELQQRRFEREIELVARLQHPCIVRLFDRGVVRGRLYFAMEHVDGLPIDDFSYAHDLDPRSIARLFGDVCEALHYAHERGIVHRDLKPTNILVDARSKPHLLDFGLAKDARPSTCTRLSTLTLAGQVFGTLPYLSPEEVVLEDGGEVDARSDVYALGVMLFEVLTGVYPYPVTGRRELVRDNILFREPCSLRRALLRQGPQARLSAREVQPSLEAIVRKALRKDRGERYASAEALAVDLRNYAAGRPVRALAEGHLEGVRRLLRRHRIQVALSVAFALLAFLAAAAWRRAASEAQQARRSSAIAYSTLHSVVEHIERHAHPVAGGSAAREALLRTVASELQALQAATTEDVVGDDMWVALREQQADIDALCGRQVEAEAGFRAVLERMPPAPQGLAATVRRARVHRKLADVSEDGQADYTQALLLAEGALELQPEHLPAILEKQRAHLGLGALFYDHGLHADSMEQANSALGVEWPELDAENAVQVKRLRASGHNLRGGNYLRMGDAAEGMAALQLALESRQQLALQHPGDFAIRHELLFSHLRSGDAHRDAGRAELARPAYGRAIDIGEELVRIDPQVKAWTRDLFDAHDRMARLLLDAGDDQAALHGEAAWTLAHTLRDSDPADPRWRRMLGYAYVLRGRVAAAEERWEDALSDYHQAVMVRQALADQAPGRTELMVELAEAHDLLARSHRAVRQPAEALRAYQRAYAIRQELLAREPDAVERELGLIRSRVNLAAWHLSRKSKDHDRDAGQLLDLAAARLEGLRDAGRLNAMTGRYDRWMGTIDRNKQRLQRRRKPAASPDG